MQKTKIRIGVDPGKSGGIVVFINNDQPIVHPMYVSNKEYDIAALARIFLPYSDPDRFDLHVVLEDVHAIHGSAAGATFEFGRGLGIIEGILGAYDIRYTKVQPKKWQKVAFEGVKEIRKPASAKQQAIGRNGGVDTKAMALVAIRRLFPTLKLTLGGPRATKPHDGLVDSVLIGYFCKLNF
jgi:hypothetical protein